MSRVEDSAYFLRAVAITKSMFPGVFVYVFFAGLVEYFKWDIFLYTSPADVKHAGIALIALSVVSFPISKEIEKHAAFKSKSGENLLKRLYWATIINLAAGELSAVFGIILYVMSGDVRYFFLFFNICLLHIIVNRPVLAKWKKYMKERFTSLPGEE
jgi:hypothetical protein